MNEPKIFFTSFASIYPLYIQKAERKGRTEEEVDKIICWLTGYSATGLRDQLDRGVSLKEFFEQAPQINENASLIKGTICGYRIEEIKDELMKKIRYLDKMVDELAKGRAMDKILRTQ